MTAKARSELCDSPREELASAVTHGFGLLASIAALILAITAAGNTLALGCSIVYGASLVFLYLSSTLYHTFSSPRIKVVLQVLDHAGIYLLIAGSYTPINLIVVGGSLGWVMFGIIWAIAIGGIITKSIMRKNMEHWASTALYVLMGWLALLVLPALINQLWGPALILLVAGGLFYTSGVIFYSWRKLLFNHAIWHLFVMAGSVCHALTIIFYILP